MSKIKIALDYDTATGQISDDSMNVQIMTWADLAHLEVKPDAGGMSLKMKNILRLRKEGLTVQDIIDLKNEDLL